MYTKKHKNQHVIQTVYMEYKLIVKAKYLGINISAVCNEALMKAVIR
jgi:post-segregation antitoxin (ccd killing protein)